MLGLSQRLSTGTSRQTTNAVLDRMVEDFYSRVALAGGTSEQSPCFKAALYNLGLTNLNTYDYLRFLRERWSESGATIETSECSTNTYFFLNTKR